MEGIFGFCRMPEDWQKVCWSSVRERGRSQLFLVDDVLEFELVVDFSRSKPQTAQFDDSGPDGVLVVAMRALVIEIIDAEDRGSDGDEKNVCGVRVDDLRKK